MKWLLALYPPAWQQRYRRELETHLADEPRSLRLGLDLIAGAIDAWAHPECFPVGDVRPLAAARCGTVDISRGDAGRSAEWMLGVTFALTTLGVVLDKTVGPHVAIEALIYASFFIALTVSSRHTYLKPYSRTVQTVLLVASSVGWYVFFLTVTALAVLT